jgi:hypothetical protein
MQLIRRKVFAICMALLVPAISTAGPCDAFFKFDGNLSDSTGNIEDGVVITAGGKPGKPVFVEGRSGQALSLDGTYAMRASLDLHYNVCPQVTIMAWININGDTPPRTQTILSTGTGSGPGIRVSGTMLAINGTNNGIMQRQAVRPNGGWQFVAASYDFDTNAYRMFWGNRNSEPQKMAGLRYEWEDAFWVGALHDSLNGAASGMLVDEVRIIGSALSPEQILALKSDMPSSPKTLPGDQFNPKQLPGDQFDPTQQLPGDQFDPKQLPGDQFDPNQLPGDQFDPNQLPGDQFSPTQQLPGDQFDPKQLPGDQFVPPKQLPGDQFDPNQLPGDQFDPNQLPGDQFSPTQQLPGDQFDPKKLPGDQFVPPKQLPGDQFDPAQPTSGSSATPSSVPGTSAMVSGMSTNVDAAVADRQNQIPVLSGTSGGTANQSASAAAASASQEQAAPVPVPVGNPVYSDIAGLEGVEIRQLDSAGQFLRRINLDGAHPVPGPTAILPCRLAISNGAGGAIPVLNVGACNDVPQGATIYTGPSVSLSDSVISRIQVCGRQASTSGPNRINGLRVWGQTVNSDGSLTYQPSSDAAWDRAFSYCAQEASWSPNVLCPGNTVGTGLVAHVRITADGLSTITGLQLICRLVGLQ